MMNRTNFPSFLKKTQPATPASRMKSSRRQGLGADMSEASDRHKRSFISKPSRKNFLH
jgi:hypothetical protein